MKTYIQIKSSIYEVRREGDKREVNYEGEWIDAADIANYLIGSKKYGELAELTLHGAKIVNKMISKDKP